MNRRPLLLLALSLLALSAGAQERSVAPGINAPYADPDWQTWVGVFERDGREVYDHRHRIIEALELRPGMAVADVGAGTGLFTRLMAREVGPEGRVYAVDIAEEFVANTLRTAREAGLDNVVGVVNRPRDVALPPASVDLVFIADTYHHFEYPEDTMASIHRALRPDGRVVVIDFRRIPGLSSPWVLGHVRAGREVFTREIEASGFALEEQLDFMPGQYFLRFRRVDPGA
jgi:ubiquinone/menaquinone biosynthesis C-methylase UbiE